MSSSAIKKLSSDLKIWLYKYPRVYAQASRVRRIFRRLSKYTYPESALAHRYLDGLHGLEIGPSAYNSFGLDTLNLNCSPEVYRYNKFEQELVGKPFNLDLIALGDALPFPDNHLDFILTSHVIEHFLDPIKALQEWYRAIKPGGYLFTVVPHKERTFDKHRSRTPLTELIDRHAAGVTNVPSEQHHCVWIMEDFLELCAYLKLPVVESQDPDDKVGNGFTVVIQKPALQSL